MKTVSEVSRLTGVSVRTLHHYDAIGLLTPSEVTEAGYRLYDDTAVQRLQSILLFRELQFPLGEIRGIIDSPGFDCREAVSQQIGLLELKRKRLDEIILSAKRLIEEGADIMDFKAFGNEELEKYAEEVKSRWGGTEAYREYEQKAAAQSEKEQSGVDAELMSIFAEFGALKQLSPDCGQAQELVEKLRQHITEKYYTCTVQILSGLGLMYTGDERFRKNIDAAGGDGTAEFAAKAIEIYCGKN